MYIATLDVNNKLISMISVPDNIHITWDTLEGESIVVGDFSYLDLNVPLDMYIWNGSTFEISEEYVPEPDMDMPLSDALQNTIDRLVKEKLQSLGLVEANNK